MTRAKEANHHSCLQSPEEPSKPISLSSQVFRPLVAHREAFAIFGTAEAISRPLCTLIAETSFRGAIMVIHCISGVATLKAHRVGPRLMHLWEITVDPCARFCAWTSFLPKDQHLVLFISSTHVLFGIPHRTFSESQPCSPFQAHLDDPYSGQAPLHASGLWPSKPIADPVAYSPTLQLSKNHVVDSVQGHPHHRGARCCRTLLAGCRAQRCRLCVWLHPFHSSDEAGRGRD